MRRSRVFAIEKASSTSRSYRARTEMPHHRRHTRVPGHRHRIAQGDVLPAGHDHEPGAQGVRGEVSSKPARRQRSCTMSRTAAGVSGSAGVVPLRNRRKMAPLWMPLTASHASTALAATPAMGLSFSGRWAPAPDASSPSHESLQPSRYATPNRRRAHKRALPVVILPKPFDLIRQAVLAKTAVDSRDA